MSLRSSLRPDGDDDHIGPFALARVLVGFPEAQVALTQFGLVGH